MFGVITKVCVNVSSVHSPERATYVVYELKVMEKVMKLYAPIMSPIRILG